MCALTALTDKRYLRVKSKSHERRTCDRLKPTCPAERIRENSPYQLASMVPLYIHTSLLSLLNALNFFSLSFFFPFVERCTHTKKVAGDSSVEDGGKKKKNFTLISGYFVRTTIIKFLYENLLCGSPR